MSSRGAFDIPTSSTDAVSQPSSVCSGIEYWYLEIFSGSTGLFFLSSEQEIDIITIRGIINLISRLLIYTPLLIIYYSDQESTIFQNMISTNRMGMK
jgi:hypothetical protein